MAVTGRVLRFDAAKQFCFLKPLTAYEPSKKIFVHFSEVRGNAIQVNDVVNFDIAEDATGRLQALNVTGGTGAPLPAKGEGKRKGKGDGKAASRKGAQPQDCATIAGAPNASLAIIPLSPKPDFEELEKTLAECMLPFRSTLEKAAMRFGKQARRLFKGEFEFQPAGSVYCTQLNFAVDLDIILMTADHLQARHLDSLLRLAQDAFVGPPLKFRVGNEDETEGFELPWSDFCREQFCMVGPMPISAFIITGLYRVEGGFEIPMDIAISSGSKREPLEHRIQKIAEKCEAGDYAKVLQKVRTLLKPRHLRDGLCKEINEEIGKLRFLVKQLTGPSDMMYLQNILRFSGLETPAVRDAWGAFAAAEMQRRAGGILQRLRGALAPHRSQAPWIALFLDATSDVAT